MSKQEASNCSAYPTIPRNIFAGGETMGTKKATATSGFLTTIEFAAAIRRSDQTIRKLHCQTGEAFGIKPSKVGRLLLWPVASVNALLSGASHPVTSDAA